MGNRIFAEYAAASQEASSVPLLPVGPLAGACTRDDTDATATPVPHSPADDANSCPMHDANAAISARLERIELLFDKLQFLAAQTWDDYGSEHDEASDKDTSLFFDGSPPATLRSFSEQSSKRIPKGTTICPRGRSLPDHWRHTEQSSGAAGTLHSIDDVPIAPESYRDPHIEPVRYIPTPRRYDVPRVQPISVSHLRPVVSSTSLPKLPSVLSPPAQAKCLLTHTRDVPGEHFPGNKALSGRCLANNIITLTEQIRRVSSDAENCNEKVLPMDGQRKSRTARKTQPHMPSNAPSNTSPREDGPSASSNASSGVASRKEMSSTPSNVPSREDEPCTPSNVFPGMSSRDDGSCTSPGLPLTEDGSRTPLGMPLRNDGPCTPSGMPLTENGLRTPFGMPLIEDGPRTPSGMPLTEDGPRTPSGMPLTEDGARTPSGMPLTDDGSGTPFNALSKFSNSPPSTPSGVPPSPSQKSAAQTPHYTPCEDAAAGGYLITSPTIRTPLTDKPPTSEIKHLSTPHDNRFYAITPRPPRNRTPQSGTDESSSNCSTASECNLASSNGGSTPRSVPMNMNTPPVFAPPLSLFMAAPALTRPRLSAAIPRLNLAPLRDGVGQGGSFAKNE